MVEQNLPALLTASAPVLGLPDGLLAKAEEVRSSGGAEGLLSSLGLIETLRGDTDAILRQVKQMLDDEAAADEEAVSEFGASQWNRPRSAALNKNLLQALESYRNSYATALQSDSQLQRQLDEAMVGITALGSSQAELEASIPASSSASSTRGDAKLAERVRLLLAEAEGSFDELRSATVAQIQEFCAGDLVEEEFKAALEGEAEMTRVLEFVSERVERIVGPFEESLRDIEAYQLGKLEELRSAAQAYTASCSSPSNSLHERQVALQTLESAHRTFRSLSTHLEEAMRFYSGLLGLVERLRENARDFVVSRELEMKEMKTALLERIADAADAAMNLNRMSNFGGSGFGAGAGSGMGMNHGMNMSSYGMNSMHGQGIHGQGMNSMHGQGINNMHGQGMNPSMSNANYANNQPFSMQSMQQHQQPAAFNPYAPYPPQPPQYAPQQPQPQSPSQWSPGMPVQYDDGQASSGAGSSSRSAAAGAYNNSAYPGGGANYYPAGNTQPHQPNANAGFPNAQPHSQPPNYQFQPRY